LGTRRKDSLKLILFGGKGGVGKTTCATSTALYLAKDYETLLISTDPAHSLYDSLGIQTKTENEIHPIYSLIPEDFKKYEELKNLSIYEISAEKSLKQFKIEYEDEIKKILDTSSYLDNEDIDSVFTLPIPGIDEVMGFKIIVDLIEEAKFDKYIIDTAPTGHALRLLTLPQLLDDWIKVLAKMRWKYRYMVTSFSGKYKPDEGDDFLFIMKKTVKRIESILKNSNMCEFIAVTIPEYMAIMETDRLIKSLGKYGIQVKQLIINNVMESEDCSFCRQRKEAQQNYIKQIFEKFENLQITEIPLQPREVKGLDEIHNFKKLLFK